MPLRGYQPEVRRLRLITYEGPDPGGELDPGTSWLLRGLITNREPSCEPELGSSDALSKQKVINAPMQLCYHSPNAPHTSRAFGFVRLAQTGWHNTHTQDPGTRDRTGRPLRQTWVSDGRLEYFAALRRNAILTRLVA